MSFGSGISAAFRMGRSVSVPTKPFSLCRSCQLCDTGFGFVGFFFTQEIACAEPTEIPSFKSPNHRLIWLPAGHIAGLS